MEPNPRPLEIFAPFGEAVDLTKKILFQPFDLGKWLVIGFAAWLATFFSGTRYKSPHFFNKGDWDFQARHFGPVSLHDTALWAIPFVLFALVFVLALVALFLWLNARARFVFTDCIVRNRAAIVEPWREYRAEGNSFFLFEVCVVFGSTLLFGGSAAVLFFTRSAGLPVVPVVLLVTLGLAWILVLLFFSLFSRFMIAVMYRQRCSALAAFRIVWDLFVAHLGVFFLYALFTIVIGVAAIMIGCIAGCVTCCIAALPYVGTVILLPVVMVLFAFPLRFLRQFGDGYDVWAVLPAIEAPPTQIPPIQETPPTAL